MNIDEIKYIADIEMMRDGHLSKGVRIEIINAVKNGHQFDLEASTEDSIRIRSELGRSGYSGRMNAKTTTYGRQAIKFNQKMK